MTTIHSIPLYSIIHTTLKYLRQGMESVGPAMAAAAFLWLSCRKPELVMVGTCGDFHQRGIRSKSTQG